LHLANDFIFVFQNLMGVQEKSRGRALYISGTRMRSHVVDLVRINRSRREGSQSLPQSLYLGVCILTRDREPAQFSSCHK
jgi:polyphosphate kinase